MRCACTTIPLSIEMQYFSIKKNKKVFTTFRLIDNTISIIFGMEQVKSIKYSFKIMAFMKIARQKLYSSLFEREKEISYCNLGLQG